MAFVSMLANHGLVGRLSPKWYLSEFFVNSTTTTTPQPFYGPFSGTTRVSRFQKRTSGLYGASED